MRQILELSDTKLKTTLINMFKPVIGKKKNGQFARIDEYCRQRNENCKNQKERL